MSETEKPLNKIGKILKDDYEQIKPSDSWEDLRSRIDKKLENVRLKKDALGGERRSSEILWRRTSFAFAASFLIMAGLLFYVIWHNRELQNRSAAGNGVVSKNLFDQARIEQLKTAFTQVRQLFGQQSGWIIIGSSDNTQIGVTDSIPKAETEQVVAVRLAVNTGKNNGLPQYCDVVTFSKQSTNFRLLLDETSTLDIGLTPTVKPDGQIEVNISAKVNNGSAVSSSGTIMNNSYTSLAQIKMNDDWIKIDGTGQSISSI